MRNYTIDSTENRRIYHIDSLRAYAILMMLQGHFIDSMIAPIYRNTESGLFNSWMFCKGFTAPIFFTVSGLILVYLLLKKEDPVYREKRIRKTIRRGFYLIFWGYLLRFSLMILWTGRLRPNFWCIDVLHCIGIALILTAVIYWLASKIGVGWFRWMLLGVGVLVFMLEPITSQLAVGEWPLFLRNYFSKANGSVFTPLPWVGYTLIGGFIGSLYSFGKRSKLTRKSMLVPIFVLIGLWLTYFSSPFLMNLHHSTGVELFKQIAYNNYLFIRLGHVFLFISIFILLEPLLARMEWFNKIGRQTLDIYIIHFVVLYGSWFGLGLARFWGYSLTPEVVIPCALLFVIGIAWLSLQFNKWKPNIKALNTFLPNWNMTQIGQKLKATFK